MTPRVGSLRRAGPPDLSRLAELWLEVARHHAALDPLFALRLDAAAEVQRLLGAEIEDADAEIFVWDAPPELLGFCTVRVDLAPPIFAETRRAEITDVGVRPAARRSGIGRALVDAALEWAHGRGVARIEVRVAVGNREGQAFWRTLGFDDLMDVLQRRL
jgi:ribosomal protein S18 acetylase RimI-like enzyme